MTTADELELTERQLEIVRMMVRGMTNQAIGAELGIGTRTVKAHLDALRLKLLVKSRRDIPMALHERGFQVYPE